MNFQLEANLVATSLSHYASLNDLGGLLFNGRILVYGTQVLDNWLTLPIQMRGFWGVRLRNEIWNLAKYCSTEDEIKSLLESVKNGESSRDIIFQFKYRILTRLEI